MGALVTNALDEILERPVQLQKRLVLQARRELDELKRQTGREWIRPSDRLPDDDREVLAAIHCAGVVTHGIVTYDEREEKGERWIGAESLEPIDGDVLGWMDLPALPKARRR